jgi:CheY-like chemotaxis protein
LAQEKHEQNFYDASDSRRYETKALLRPVFAGADEEIRSGRAENGMQPGSPVCAMWPSYTVFWRATAVQAVCHSPHPCLHAKYENSILILAPRIDARLVLVLIDQPAVPVSRRTRTRILLAEDNPQDVYLLKEAFEVENLDVELDCVSDGDELLTRLLRIAADDGDKYDLVLLDSHLPRRDTEDVLVILQSQQKSLSVPVIVLTSLISEPDKVRLLDLGVNEVLSKPLDLNEYFSLVRQLNSVLGGSAG